MITHQPPNIERRIRITRARAAFLWNEYPPPNGQCQRLLTGEKLTLLFVVWRLARVSLSMSKSHYCDCATWTRRLLPVFAHRGHPTLKNPTMSSYISLGGVCPQINTYDREVELLFNVTLYLCRRHQIGDFHIVVACDKYSNTYHITIREPLWTRRSMTITPTNVL